MRTLRELRPKSPRHLLAAFVTATFLFLLAIIGYAMYLRHSARILVKSAERIHTSADANRWIEKWRGAGKNYSETSSPDGLGRAYQVRQSNWLLSSLHLVPTTDILVQVSTLRDELDMVLVGIYTEQSSVWVQEEFLRSEREKPHFDLQRAQVDKPIKVVLMLSEDVAPEKRRSAFQLNVDCIARLGGCKSARELLPTIQELGTGYHMH